MMSCTPTKSRLRSAAGFTLVEMLVVIGIIVLLIGILAPALNIAYTHSIRNRMALDIQSISAALEVYNTDMKGYPTLDYNDTKIMSAAYPASVLLCRALIAPGGTLQDGYGVADSSGTDHPAPGFRIIPNGQVYGPYLEVGRFKLVVDPVLGADPNNNNFFLADRYSHPILYFKAFRAADPALAYVKAWKPAMGPPQPMYNFNDDSGSTTNPALVLATDSATTQGLTRMQLMLGDKDASGKIENPPEQAANTQPFLLWGAGPDEIFGVDLSKGNKVAASYVPGCDDATNFTQ